MPRKYLGRIPKRRRHTSFRRTNTGPSVNRDNNNLSDNLSVPSSNNVHNQSNRFSSFASARDNNDNHLPLSTNPFFRGDIIIPQIAPNPETIIDVDMQQQTDLPNNIQIQNSSSSISSMTTSIFDNQAINSSTDESSDKNSRTTHFSVSCSAEEKSRRLSLFSKPSDKSNRTAYDRKRHLIHKLKRTLKALGNDDQGGVILEETLNDPVFHNLKKKLVL